MKFKLEKIVELKESGKCDGCPFEGENECLETYCAATEDKFLIFGDYDDWGHYVGAKGPGLGGG